MISEIESIPTKSNAFLENIDIFYTQFNEVDFYIEDEDQENFYYLILKNLFSNITLGKIFPLRGKDNVIKNARLNTADKRKVYIVDKDFDDLLGKTVPEANVFYLDRYSIENFLIEEDAILNYIVGEKPKLNIVDNKAKLEYGNLLSQCYELYYELTILYILIQSLELGIPNSSCAADRYVDFKGTIAIREDALQELKTEIEIALKQRDQRFTLRAQIVRLKTQLSLGNTHLCAVHVPGKYVIKYIKSVIEGRFSLSSRNMESFCYRIAEGSTFTSLLGLKHKIQLFLN